jgi:hypothetical protein
MATLVAHSSTLLTTPKKGSRDTAISVARLLIELMTGGWKAARHSSLF